MNSGEWFILARPTHAVEIFGIDRLTGKAELENLYLASAVEHLVGIQALDH